MGYYENPPIVQPSRGSEIVSSAIVDAANSLSKGLMIRGERKRQEEKEKRLTLQKLQDRKNETDLLYNEKLSDWSKDQTHIDNVFDKKLYDLVQQKITLAADSKIALLNETNAEKRQEYLKNIRNAEGFITSTSAFAKNLGQQVATNRLNVKAVTLGEPGGFVVNGATDKEILDNTATLEVLGGMTSMYSDVKIDVEQDEVGDGAILKVSGKHKDGSDFNVSINSKAFERSDVDTDDGLLIPVESLDTFHTKVKEGIMDEKKGGVYDGYLLDTHETYDLDSKGTSGGIGPDVYQIKNGRRLQTEAIKASIREKAQVTAQGILASDSPARLRTLLNYTLKQGVGFYDEKFKNLSPQEQKDLLTNTLTEQSFYNMTKNLEKTTEKDGTVIYWNPTGDGIQLKDKPSPSRSSSSSSKEEPYTYKEKYMENAILGPRETVRSGSKPYRAYEERTDLVKQLNRTAGQSYTFVTRDDIYKRWKNQPYEYAPGKFSDKTIEQEYKDGKMKGKNIKNDFAKLYPTTSYIYVEDGQDSYKALKDYNINKAEDRAKLLLDYTTDAGEKKLLQGQLPKARLKDWMDSHPMKRNETQQQYAQRARQAIGM